MAQSEAKAPALLIDAMLGDLSRRLRWLGYDAEYRNDLPDEEMMRIAKDEGRLLVTRDRALAGRRGVQALYVAATDLDAQLQTVVDTLGPSSGPARCTVCNGELESLSPEQAAPLVPPYIARTQTDFRRCTHCHRVYWPGTHWQGLQAWGGWILRKWAVFSDQWTSLAHRPPPSRLIRVFKFCRPFHPSLMQRDCR